MAFAIKIKNRKNFEHLSMVHNRNRFRTNFLPWTAKITAEKFQKILSKFVDNFALSGFADNVTVLRLYPPANSNTISPVFKPIHPLVPMRDNGSRELILTVYLMFL